MRGDDVRRVLLEVALERVVSGDENQVSCLDHRLASFRATAHRHHRRNATPTYRLRRVPSGARAVEDDDFMLRLGNIDRDKVGRRSCNIENCLDLLRISQAGRASLIPQRPMLGSRRFLPLPAGGERDPRCPRASAGKGRRDGARLAGHGLGRLAS
jgi:hypothetical protein